MAVRRVPKPTGTLKAFLDTSKRPSRLLGAVERHLLTRTPDDRRQDVIHPSELVKSDFCRRASYYALTGATKPHKPPTLALQNIFDEGHAIHDKWQTRFREMDALYGRWSCPLCDETWWDTSPAECPSCQAFGSLLRYSEVSLASKPEYRISGHSDGWIKGIGDDCLIEIKSIGAGTIRLEAPEIWTKADGNLDEAWMNVKRPFGSHIRQGVLYLALCQQMCDMGYLDSAPGEIVFIYELKANQQVKEFTVAANPDLVASYLDTAARVVSAVDKGVPPACNMNLQSGCQKCRAYEEGQ